MADGPRPVEVEVGRRLKRRRTLLGMSQERLGDLLGVTYQQVQKYERGVNRVGSSRLYDICRILDVPVAYFFDDVQAAAPAAPPAAAPSAYGFGLAEAPSGFAFDGGPPPTAAAAPSGSDSIEDRETLELVRAFRRIRDPLVRRRLFELAKALGELAHRRPGSAGRGAGDPGPS